MIERGSKSMAIMVSLLERERERDRRTGVDLKGYRVAVRKKEK